MNSNICVADYFVKFQCMSHHSVISVMSKNMFVSAETARHIELKRTHLGNLFSPDWTSPSYSYSV